MQNVTLKIRGIYTTALIRLFLDMGYGIAQPSVEMCERFRIPQDETVSDISIVDRKDRQGIRVSGTDIAVEALTHRLWDTLLDPVVRPEPGSSKPGTDEMITVDVEFPGASKASLDHLRNRVVPTLPGHHRLRIIASDDLDRAEADLERKPDLGESLERGLAERWILQPLRKQGVVELEHVKPEGEVLKLREGEILSLEEGKLILRREFQGGYYDGLDLPIEPGDYGITEAELGGWTLRHRYLAKGGALKGEYWNVNTPVELYADRLRYVDLHVDVLRRRGEPPRIIDQSKLESSTRKGLISPRLQHKALDVASRLLKQMARSR